MDKLSLFQVALGIQPPWYVKHATFHPKPGQLDLFLDFREGARFPCPESDMESCPVHDTVEREWRHLDFFQHRAYLHARVPRVKCPKHGVLQITVPWARPGSRFTLLFELMILELAPHMPVAAIARHVGEHDTRLWRVLEHYVEAARAEADYSEVTEVGIDETSARRGHDYVTLFMDLARPRVLYATEGKDAATVERFASDLRLHGGDPARVTDVCCDMSPAFISGTTDHLPKAELTYDRYHIVQKLSEAIDEVRRMERKERPELRKTRYIWLKRPKNLTAKQRETLAWLNRPSQRLKTVRAYRWALDFQGFYEQPKGLAEDYLTRWCRGAKRSRLEPIKDFVSMVESHWDGVLRWHSSRINNGILEGTASLIQAAKRKARGYRTKRNLITMIYLIAGRLPLPSTHTI